MCLSIEISTVPGCRIEPLYGTSLKWGNNRGVRKKERKGRMESGGITQTKQNKKGERDCSFQPARATNESVDS